MRRYRPSIGWGCALLAVLLYVAPGAAVPARAQEGAPDGGQNAERATLRASLERVRSELAHERAALSGLRADWGDAQATLERQRDALARELVDAQLAQHREDTRAARGEAGMATAVVAHERLAEGAKVVLAAARTAAQQAAIQARELPGYEAERKALDALARALEAPSRNAAEGLLTAATLAEHLERLHARAGAVTLRRAELRTAHGLSEPVALLSAGHVAFAYRAEDGRLGLALHSPRHAQGFRWSESLSAAERDALQAAFHSVGAGRPGLVALPMDVSGRLSPDTLERTLHPLRRLREGGPVMLPLFAVAALSLLLMGERAWRLYAMNRGHDSFAARVLVLGRDGELAAAEQLCRRRRGVVARTLEACLARRAGGAHAMEDSVQERLLHEAPRVERFTGALAVLAGVAPLLGLLGTVTGIIQTFGVIRRFGNAHPELMAGGISEALTTTAAGLAIAIPAMLAASLFRARVERILADAERHAASLLNAIVHDGKP